MLGGTAMDDGRGKGALTVGVVQVAPLKPPEQVRLDHRLDKAEGHILETRQNWSRQLPGWF